MQKILKFLLICLLVFSICPQNSLADFHQTDSDNDGLTNSEEINIYHSDPYNSDSDNDGYNDGYEIKYNYDPNKSTDDKLQKVIQINLSDQSLSYFSGQYLIDNFKISSGLKKTPTPTGDFEILEKKPVVTYRGAGYFYPNTRWNMLFKKAVPGNYYIHGTYWHNNFGTPMSHGCINIVYEKAQNLYNWTDVGTKILIR